MLPQEGPEDEQQEKLTRELEAATASIPAARVRRNREYGYGLTPSTEEGLMVSDAFTLNIAALEKVIEWSTEQASIVRLAVVEYLESPDDERLSDVLNLCGIEKENRKTRKEDTLTALLKRSLPATLEELYVVARRNHRSNRPEAAVRQTLRNLKKRGLVSEDERGRISLTANLDSPT